MKSSGGEDVETSLEEGDWTSIHPKGECPPPHINTFPSSNYRSVSEEIAHVSFQPCFLYTCYNLSPEIPGANSSSSQALGTSIYSRWITSCNRETVPRHLSCIWSIFVPIKKPGYLGRLWCESDVLFCKLPQNGDISGRSLISQPR